MSLPEAAYFPAAHALDVLAVAESHGLSCARVLAGSSLIEARLHGPDARVSLGELQGLIERVQQLTGSGTLGIEVGLRMRAPVHGFLGFAIMSSPTLLDGLTLVARYTPTRTNALTVELVHGEREATLFLEPACELGSAHETVITALAVSSWKIAQSMTQVRFEARAELAFPSAAGVDKTEVRELSVRYGRARSRVCFANALLDLPIVTAQPSGLELATAELERALELAGSATMTARVQAALKRCAVDASSIQEIARTLGTSSSTLKRKLGAEGAVFSALWEEEQRQRACQLLRAERLSIEQVAERAGYSDVSNFTRAFRRWTGTTPAAYRKTHTG